MNKNIVIYLMLQLLNNKVDKFEDKDKFFKYLLYIKVMPWEEDTTNETVF